MVRGYATFKQFEESDEGIATNILADRLRRLEKNGIITREREKNDGRKASYRLSQKGIDLAPLLLELLIWGAQHEETMAPRELISQMADNRESVIAEARRRWHERDSTPLLPSFADQSSGGKPKRR